MATCTMCHEGDAVVSAVLPGYDGRIGSPGTHEVHLCLACDAKVFVKR